MEDLKPAAKAAMAVMSEIADPKLLADIEQLMSSRQAHWEWHGQGWFDQSQILLTSSNYVGRYVTVWPFERRFEVHDPAEQWWR